MHKQTSKAISPWAELDAIMAKEQEPTGPGWFTQDEFCARYKIHRNVAWERLKRMVEDGALECWTGRIEVLKRRGCKYRLREAH